MTAEARASQQPDRSNPSTPDTTDRTSRANTVAGSRIGLHHVVAHDRRPDHLTIAEHHAVDVV
jgi:hypothetical protein